MTSAAGSAVAGSAAAGSAREERHDAVRLQRIVDLIEDSLAKPNALEAHLGVLIGELLAMARMTGLAIAAALARDGETLDYGGTMQQAIHRYLKVVKQVERFSELQDRRDRDARRAPARDFGPAWPAR